ncbi:MAG: low molecular weight protein-tyrosine-phosphatase [Acidimicrobiales bacterium]
MTDREPFRLLFVCLGNICRSPTAEGVMRSLLAEAGLDGVVEVDSAGTAGWHVGDPPDERTVAEGWRRGLDLSGQRGRRLDRGDLVHFDLLIAMDETNREDLLALAPGPDEAAKVCLLREFDPAAVEAGELDVPDPYYGGPSGFAHVYDVVEGACRGLLDHVRANLLGGHPRR